MVQETGSSPRRDSIEPGPRGHRERKETRKERRKLREELEPQALRRCRQFQIRTQWLAQEVFDEHRPYHRTVVRTRS